MEKEYEYRIKVTYEEGDEFWVEAHDVLHDYIYYLTRFDECSTRFIEYDDALYCMNEFKEYNPSSDYSIQIIKTSINDIINFKLGPGAKKVLLDIGIDITEL